MNKVVVVFFLFLSVPLVCAAQPDFTTDKPFILTTVEQGETLSLDLTLLNQGSAQDLALSVVSDISFFTVDRSQVHLERDGSLSLHLSLGSTLLAPGVYVGSVRITGKDSSRVIPVVLEVQSSPLAFDASILELPSYSELRAGYVFTPQITVYNLRSLDPTVTLIASIYTPEGNRIATSSSLLEVRNTLESSLALPLPDVLPEGPYILAVELIAGASHGTATTSLYVVDGPLLSPPSSSNRSFYYALVVIGVLLFGFIVINYLWKRHMVSRVSYWDKQLHKARLQGDNPRARRSLVYQRQLLEEAHTKGYISQASYRTSRARLDAATRRLKKRL